MRRCINILLVVFIASLLTASSAWGRHAQQYLDQGWKLLVHDNDTEAFKNFREAYETAQEQHNGYVAAESLLYMGICSYGTSYANGLHYASDALAEYKKLEKENIEKATAGRLKCLQLISTIYSRQGKYSEAITLSRQVLSGFTGQLNNEEGYAGLAATSLGDAYKALGRQDSAEYYYRMALEERLRTRNSVYLPLAYINVAAIELAAGHKEESYKLYQQALHIADSTANKQALILAYLGIGKWQQETENYQLAEDSYRRAFDISGVISDKLFRIKALVALVGIRKKQGDYAGALAYQDSLSALKDSLGNWEKDRIVKSLEVQFRVQETQQELMRSKQEHKITVLTNYILWGTIGIIIIFSSSFIFLLKRINDRDKQLLAAKELLIEAINEEKKQKELLMQNEIEYKEAQLSALVLQMQQKNELMQELKDRIAQDTKTAQDMTLNKIISKGVNHDKEWTDFNTYFESINKNFYSRLKSAYPDISPNDLKICALIKLNMSIKEMAGVLNISPDSVKTARYRLRKKLQMDTEDNLTDFILSL